MEIKYLIKEDSMPEKLYLTVKETAQSINISDKLIYKMIQDNKIPHTRISNKILIPKNHLDEWLRKNTFMI